MGIPDVHFVTAIASSAGGIKPLQELLGNAYCHKGMAFVLVPHMGREAKTALPEILSKTSGLDAQLAEDGMRLRPCHVYLQPPGFYLSVEGGVLRLHPRPDGVVNQSADHFFRSLARDYGKNAVGVVLSGSAIGADGSEGVKAIKKLGGHTYAQEPSTATFPEMPQLAIETGCVDSVLPPEDIGHELSLLSIV